MFDFNGISAALALPDVAGVGDFSLACRFKWLSRSGAVPTITSASNEPTDPRTSFYYMPQHYAFGNDAFSDGCGK